MQTQTMKLRELTIRYAVRKDQDGQPVIVGRALGRPSEAASALITLLQDEPSEVFAILCLTTKHRVIAYHEVSRGTLDSVPASPREVFTAAVLSHAAAIIACEKARQSALGRRHGAPRPKERGKRPQPWDQRAKLGQQRRAKAHDASAGVVRGRKPSDGGPRVGVGIAQVEHMEAPEPTGRN
jgi:hypothetical protein